MHTEGLTQRHAANQCYNWGLTSLLNVPFPA